MILRNNEIFVLKVECEVYEWKVEKRRFLMCELLILVINVIIFVNKVDEFSFCEVLIIVIGENCVIRVVWSENLNVRLFSCFVVKCFNNFYLF